MLSAQAIRFLPRLFLLALAVEVARSAFLNLWERLVVLPSIRPGTIFSPEAFNFASSLVTFMISPCVLFVGLYYMSRAYSLDLELKSIGSSLFLGGAVGAVLSLIVAAESFYGSDVSGLANYLATELSSAWTLGSLLVDAVSDGLFNVFVGVAAFVIASRVRADVSTAPAVEDVPPAEER